MYRKEIEGFIDSHRQEMIDDICKLCRINSEKMPYTEGKPYGDGAFDALHAALAMMEDYGFSITNYDNYVGTADLNDKERQLDILAHLDVVPEERVGPLQSPLSLWKRMESCMAAVRQMTRGRQWLLFMPCVP